MQVKGDRTKINGKNAVYFHTDKLVSKTSVKLFNAIVHLEPTEEGTQTLVIEGYKGGDELIKSIIRPSAKPLK